MLLLLLLTGWLSAQQDSIVVETISICATPIRDHHIGEIPDTIRTSFLSNDFADSAINGGIYMKRSGNDGLSTITLRGSSAGQTVILWNDIPLASPMLGQLDYSLIPSGITEEIIVNKGGNSSMWGSGAIGGVISLGNEVFHDKSFNLSTGQTLGSFGLYHQQYKAQYGKGKWYASSLIDLYNRDNDYTFRYGKNQIRDTLENAQVHRNNLYQNIGLKINSKLSLEGHLWYQKARRQIAPTYVQRGSTSYQEDDALRAVVKAVYRTGRFQLQSTMGYVDESIAYYMSEDGKAIPSGFQSFIYNMTHDYYLSNSIKWMLGMNYTYTEAEAQGYSENKEEHRGGFLTGFIYSKNRLGLKIVNRINSVDGEYTWLIPSIGVTYSLSKDLKWNGKVSYNYRNPTLNDRYWRPGGNEFLSPEEGWSQETSLAFSHSNHHFRVGVYNRMIDNWILWIPSENRNIWQAENINQVWSRGMEVKYEYVHKALFTEVDYALTRSTYRKSLELPSLAEGDQLYYVPKHMIGGLIGYQSNSLKIAYRHRVISGVEGVRKKIEGYNIGGVMLEKTIDWKKHKINVMASAQNIWNASYEVVDYSRMPERNYTIGIKLNINY